MGRQARIVVEGWPHHVTQRGNRRQIVFFRDADYLLYLQLARECFAQSEAEVWGYCLMPNHVHLIIRPRTKDALRAPLAKLHARYARAINGRERWAGHLWQARFASFPMDTDYFVQASRYVGLNPVRAGLVAHARDWPWSSVGAHLSGKDDALVRVAPLVESVRQNMARFFEADVADMGTVTIWIWTSVAHLAGDLQIADDYAFYLQNRAIIDAVIAEPWTSMSQAQKDFYSANEAFMTRALAKAANDNFASRLFPVARAV